MRSVRCRLGARGGVYVTRAIAALTISLALACSRGPGELGYIAASVREARQRGLIATTGTVNAPYEPAESLQEVLAQYTVSTLTVAKVSALTTQTADDITTWHSVRIDQVLWEPPVTSAQPCFAEWPESLARPSGVLFPVFGGTVTIEGVRVTLRSRLDAVWPTFSPGSQYLVFGTVCQSGRVQLTHGPEDTFALSPSGDIRPSGRTSLFAQEVGRFGSVASLRNYLQQRK